MKEQDNVIRMEKTGGAQAKSILEEVLREGARQLLQQAIENEVAEYIIKHQAEKDERNHRWVTRNGHLPERDLQTGLGPVRVRQPRVHDRRENHSFTSRLLPPYLRRAPSLDARVPAMYLKGVSTGDMQQALEALLGPQAAGLSATNVVRLKESWTPEYEAWQKRDLTGKRYVYLWADGIYFNVRLDEDRPCVLVLIRALEDGTKELVAIHDGYRESKQSWREVSVQDRQFTKRWRWIKLGEVRGAMRMWSA